MISDWLTKAAHRVRMGASKEVLQPSQDVKGYHRECGSSARDTGMRIKVEDKMSEIGWRYIYG